MTDSSWGIRGGEIPGSFGARLYMSISALGAKGILPSVSVTHYPIASCGTTTLCSIKSPVVTRRRAFVTAVGERD